MSQKEKRKEIVKQQHDAWWGARAASVVGAKKTAKELDDRVRMRQEELMHLDLKERRDKDMEAAHERNRKLRDANSHKWKGEMK